MPSLSSFARTSFGRLSAARRAADLRIHRWRLTRSCILAPDATITDTARVMNSAEPGAVTIGAQTLFMGEVLIVRAGGEVRIGEWCFIGPHARIWSLQSIAIGDRVFVSHGVHIFDNNSHSLSAGERHARFQELQREGRHLTPEAVVSRPIRIEDDAWIGFNAAILKGVTVGRGAVVAAGCVVTKDVAPYAIVAGNPARVVGESRP
jgi:acetyltransferase-like isoleucine patch superfamily enzyme